MRKNWARWTAAAGGVGPSGATTPFSVLGEYSSLSEGQVWVLKAVEAMEGNDHIGYKVVGSVDMLNAIKPPAKKRKPALRVCPHCGGKLR